MTGQVPSTPHPGPGRLEEYPGTAGLCSHSSTQAEYMVDRPQTPHHSVCRWAVPKNPLSSISNTWSTVICNCCHESEMDNADQSVTDLLL